MPRDSKSAIFDDNTEKEITTVELTVTSLIKKEPRVSIEVTEERIKEYKDYHYYLNEQIQKTPQNTLLRATYEHQLGRLRYLCEFTFDKAFPADIKHRIGYVISNNILAMMNCKDVKDDEDLFLFAWKNVRRLREYAPEDFKQHPLASSFPAYEEIAMERLRQLTLTTEQKRMAKNNHPAPENQYGFFRRNITPTGFVLGSFTMFLLLTLTAPPSLPIVILLVMLITKLGNDIENEMMESYKKNRR